MYRHILIPTDGSELAERGVAHGLALAKSVGAKIYVIYVVEPLLAVTGDFASVLDRAEKAAKEAGVSCETIQVENVQPHQAIIAAAEDEGCDLIVMSWHGRSGLSTLLIGSVTSKVLTYAKTPVLVCR
jgi:nucleotide-binding universal stress UspA family protein